MGDKWICSNCGAENALKFCTKCGTPRPEPEQPPVIEEENTWDCPCGAIGNTGNFCKHCGTPRSQAVVKAVAEVIAEPVEEVAEEAVPEEIVPEVEVPELEIPEPTASEVEAPELEISEAVIPEVEIPEVEAPELEIPKVEIPEVEIPEVKAPELEIPEVAAVEEAAVKAAAAEDGTWDCTCGQTGNKGNFCRNCGLPKEQGMARSAANNVFGAEAPTMKAPEVPQPAEPKKKKSPKLLIILIAAAVVVAAIVVALVLLLGQKKYTVNPQPQGEVLEVKDEFSLFVDQDRDISFLYPNDLLADRGEDGDRIYGGQKEEYPYVLINRVNETTKPKDYFKQYQESLKQQYGDIDFSEIYEVEVEGKTVYMVQTYIPEGGFRQDQYLELYDDCYITYTAKGYESSNENRELYYAIGSLRTSADAYPVPQAFVYENEMGNFSVEVLPDYTVKEFTGGLYAEKGNAGLFVTYLNTDSLGAVIYGRDDFLDRADRITEYVEEIIGVNSIEFMDTGSNEVINGKDYIVFSVKMELRNGSEAEGKICVGDSDNTIGCYLMCYYLEKNSGSLQREEGENFLASMSVHGDPNIREFLVKDLSSVGFGLIAVRADLVGSIDIKDDKVEIKNPEKDQTIVMEIREGSDLYEDIASKIAQDLADQYEKSHLEEIQPPDEGRYYMNACEITYKTDKDVDRVFRIYAVSSKSDHKYCIDYDVEAGKEDWAKEVCDYLFWSWKLN